MTLFRFKKKRSALFSLCVLFLFICFSVTGGFAFEYSSITTSTIIGSNFGHPTGMGADSLPPVFEPGIAIETALFIKNLEITQLSKKDIVGQTIIQSMVPARFYYRAGNRTTVELGAILGHKFGDEHEVDIVAPLTRIVHEPRSNIFLVAGTIFPTHAIHDAMYDDIQKFGINDENMDFHDNVEQGFQFRVNRKRYKQDLWINWKTREEKNTREAFEAASVSRFQFFDESLFVNLQIRTVHIGGQNNDLDLGVDENLSMLAGLSYGFDHPFGIDAINGLRFQADYLSSSDSTLQESTETGDGYEIGVSADLFLSKDITLVLNASHYTGNDFYSRGGDPLYHLDTYSQFGLTSLFYLDREFLIETGLVAQLTDDAFNFTFMVNFLWGHGFFYNRSVSI
ncbi:MAG: hypothetical protein KJ737_10885 [Proteobacteria bacterium]|nr:hypothetical protein [Pseudomonadota bacterium]